MATVYQAAREKRHHGPKLPHPRSYHIPDGAAICYNAGNTMEPATSPTRSLSVVVPAYNEVRILPTFVRETVLFLRSHVQQFELILVDDGSQDESPAVMEELKRQFSEVRIHRHSMNLGYGSSLKDGFSLCRFEWIFVTDADRQFQIQDILSFFPLCQEAPVVVGYRKERCDSPARRLLSLGYNGLARLLFRIPTRDVNCAFKLIHAEILGNLSLEAKRFFVNTELLIKIQQQGVLIRETAVNHLPRSSGRSKVGLWEIPRTLREMALFCLTHA